MTPDQRVDYFRSELLGELDKLRKEIAGSSLAVKQRFEDLEKQVQAMLRELRSL